MYEYNFIVSVLCLFFIYRTEVKYFIDGQQGGNDRFGLFRYLFEKRLYVYNRFGVCYVVFFGIYGVFFVYNYYVGSKSYFIFE